MNHLRLLVDLLGQLKHESWKQQQQTSTKCKSKPPTTPTVAPTPLTKIIPVAKRKPPADVVATTTDSNNNNSIVVYGVDSSNQDGNDSGESGSGSRKRKSQWANNKPKPRLTSLPIQLPDFMKELTNVRDYLMPQSLAPILESLFDEYGDVGAETNLSSRLKMNRRDSWVFVCILSDFWVCVCCFCVWLTRKINCWVCVLCLVDKEDLLFLFLCLCLCFWVCDFFILILFS